MVGELNQDSYSEIPKIIANSGGGNKEEKRVVDEQRRQRMLIWGQYSRRRQKKMGFGVQMKWISLARRKFLFVSSRNKGREKE